MTLSEALTSGFSLCSLKQMSSLICFIEYAVVIPIVYLSSIAIMLWFIYQYLNSTKTRQNILLKYLGLILFCFQTMLFMMSAVATPIWALASDCAIGDELSGISVAIGGSLIVVQYLIMILLLFYRLKIVFDGTAYELSKCTIWAFFIMYILTLVSGIAYSFANDPTSSSLFEIMLVALGSLSALSNISFLSFLFIKKVIDVNKHCDGAKQSDENKLLSTITKQTILTLTSISSLVVFLAINTLLNATGTGFFISSIHGNFVFNLCVLLDNWTNFICILLSYATFDHYYTKLCGCCDIKCKQLCHRFVKPKRKDNFAHEIDEIESAQTV